jgi:hypothetical protein
MAETVEKIAYHQNAANVHAALGRVTGKNDV